MQCRILYLDYYRTNTIIVCLFIGNSRHIDETIVARTVLLSLSHWVLFKHSREHGHRHSLRFANVLRRMLLQ